MREVVLRKLTVLAALVFTALLVTAVPVAAAPLATFQASLTGEKEVPGPGDKDGLGHAVVKVYEARVCYTLEVQGIEPATAAHIHRGGPSVAGPIVVELKAPTDGSSSGCVAISRALSTELRQNPTQYYVNVHNNPYPDGAIRGQLHS